MPPLNALRAFEAAGRHESFSRAAQELHVTQGAVSRHVKLLEAHLGGSLFERRPRGLALTDRGRALLPTLSDSFQRIAEAAQQAAALDRDLKIIAPPTITIRWLMPRIAAFQERNPQIRVRFSTVFFAYDDFQRGGFDVGIDCLAGGRPPDPEEILLRREALTPVCSPALVDSLALKTPQDLAAVRLLHPGSDDSDWRRWLAAAGVEGIDPSEGQIFGTLDHAVRAAATGHGVAIGDLAIIREELESGQLVAPFDLVLSEDTGYVLMIRKGGLSDPKIVAFRDWLLDEIADDDAAVG